MARPPENKPVLHTRKHIARLERERNQTRLILIGFFAIVVSATALFLYALLYPKYIQPTITIAKVGNVSIRAGAFQAHVRMQRGGLINQLQLFQQYAQYLGVDVSSQEQQITSQLNSPSALGKTVLDSMIDDELIRQEAARRGITASTQEVDQAIQANFRFYPAGTPTPSVTPTPVSFPTLSPETLALVTITPTPTVVLTPALSPTSTADLLASPGATVSPTAPPTSGATPTPSPTDTPMPTATPYTQQGFEQAYQNRVNQYSSLGLTATEVRQLYESTLLRQKLFDLLTAAVPHSQEQVWARHILVADQASANAVRAQLVKGEDFAKVAAEVSTDTGTKAKGGDLGWFARGAMVPEFESAAFSLKVGEISQPIKSQFGYHIIQVLAHAEIPLDANGYDQAKQSAFNAWLTKARDEYKVVTFDNWQNIVPTDPPIPATPQ
jgi:parvulin-like peptidyl-prolyl isomerase